MSSQDSGKPNSFVCTEKICPTTGSQLPALLTIKVENKGSLGNLGTMGKQGKVEIGAGELAQLLAAVLGEDLSPAPSTYIRDSQLPVTPAPGGPMPLASMGTCTYTHISTCAHTYT